VSPPAIKPKSELKERAGKKAKSVESESECWALEEYGTSASTAIKSANGNFFKVVFFDS